MKNWAQKNKYWLLLLAFIICVFIFTVIGRSERISDNRLDLFWSYYEAFINGNDSLKFEVLLNIAMLFPVGFIVSSAMSGKYKRRYIVLFSAVIGMITSTLIELGQYYYFKGTAEFDDVIDNTLGAILGCIIYAALSKIKNNRFCIEKIKLPISIICVAVAAMVCISSDYTSDNIVRQLAFQANNVNIENEKLCIDGFCFTYGYDLMLNDSQSIDVAWDDSNYNILLKSLETGIYLSMDTETEIESPSVKEYFSSTYEYPNVGFRATIDVDKVEPNEEYEIMIKSGRLTVSGKAYILNGSLEKTPKKDNINLDIQGTYLQKIFMDGFLLAHNDDNSCVLYQYGMNLFWITTDNFQFDAAGKTVIEYQIWTTQLDKLKETTGNQEDWFDNRGFVFEENEITDQINSGKYRVATVKLPKEYSIAFISTGVFRNGNWEWRSNFRPRY